MFFDRKEKCKLDKITYKYVVQKIKRDIELNKNYEKIIIDAALLFESGLNDICDIIIGVIAKKEKCVERIIKRDNIDEKTAIARIDSQNKEMFFKINCDYCIFNEEGANIEKQIKDIFENRNLSNRNIIHVYDKDLEYLQFRELLKYSDKVKHLYTLKPLDFGSNADYEEKREKVLKSYENICKSLNINDKNIYRPFQTHTNVVKKVSNEKPGIYTKDFENVDGLITDKNNKILSLAFADCISLYFYDPVKNIIGNIHSGWQGTYKEIAKEAVKKLKEEYSCNPRDLICLIGPSIRKCCFEVDKEVKDMFYNKFKDIGRIDEIITENNFKYNIDTVLINRIILRQEGLLDKNIIESGICTKCENQRLHSYRKEKERSGRNTSIIVLV